MRTTLDIPEELLEEAREALGAKSNADAVILSVQDVVRRKRVEELKDLFGHIRLEIDLPTSRGRE
ncbi:MAG TPA: type II toxin-antitoxin system VapB family antitoxin [Thermoanaerobaculia bacterium]